MTQEEYAAIESALYEEEAKRLNSLTENYRELIAKGLIIPEEAVYFYQSETPKP